MCLGVCVCGGGGGGGGIMAISIMKEVRVLTWREWGHNTDYGLVLSGGV